MTQEKRAHPRYPIGVAFGVPIQITTSSGTIKGAIGDLSAGGLGIFTSAHLTPGTLVQFEFILDSQKVLCAGEIVFKQERNAEFFYGFAFIDIPLEETQNLVEYRNHIQFIKISILDTPC